MLFPGCFLCLGIYYIICTGEQCNTTDWLYHGSLVGAYILAGLSWATMVECLMVNSLDTSIYLWFYTVPSSAFLFLPSYLIAMSYLSLEVPGRDEERVHLLTSILCLSCVMLRNWSFPSITRPHKSSYGLPWMINIPWISPLIVCWPHCPDHS